MLFPGGRSNAMVFKLIASWRLLLALGADLLGPLRSLKNGDYFAGLWRSCDMRMSYS